MDATVVEERRMAERNSELGQTAIFKGRNLIRFLIASWPKITQQFVGLAVFNSYATYFCKSSLSSPICSLTNMSPQSNTPAAMTRSW